MKRTELKRRFLVLLWLAALLLHCAAVLAEDALVIEVEGLEGAPLQNVRASLGIERLKEQQQPDPERIRRLHRRAPAEIRRALEPFGYYHPTIKEELLEPKTPESPWVARYQVHAGNPVTVTKLDLALQGPGAKDPALLGLQSDFPLATGAVLDHRRYTAGKQTLVRGARRLGYLDADLEQHRIEVDPEAGSAKIELLLTTGPRYRFGPVSFQQEGFDEAYLRSFIPFRSGDPFLQESLAELRRALGSSGHFQQVEVERLDPMGENGDVIPLRVTLTPLKPNRYRARLGWGTDTGVGVHFDWTRRYLWDKGHHMSFATMLVQERAKLAADLRYGIPLDPLERTTLEFFVRHQGKDLTYEDVELTEGGETRILDNMAGVALPRPRRLWDLELEEKLELTYLTESYDVFDVLFGHYPDYVQVYIAGQLGDDRDILAPSFSALVPGVTWTYRSRDHSLYTTRGEFLRLSFKGALDGFGSNVSFLQGRISGAFIRPVARTDRLLLRGDLAYTAVDSIEVLGATFNQLPDYYEFRTGGDRSVRGYGYETLYPEDAITGGKHLLVASVEYEKSLYENWSAALFLDAGNAFNDYAEMDLKLGAGFGARWQSPVGLVRLDLGFPLNEAEDAFQIHFNIGPEF